MKTINHYLQENKILNWDGVVYHYCFTKKKVENILASNKILPANLVDDDSIKKNYAYEAIRKHLEGAAYSKPINTNAEIYWKTAYKKFYQPLLNKSYKNYGIYFSLIDLFQFDNEINFRFRYTFEELNKDKPDMVLTIGNQRSIVRRKKDLEKIMSKFEDYDAIEKTWLHTKVKFSGFPQLVLFKNSIPANESNFEQRE
jgi:hypothetical protein